MLGELLHDPIAAINHSPLLSLSVLVLAGYLCGRLCQVLITLGVLFLVTALVALLELSALIANMFAGFMLVNLAVRNRRIFAALEPLTPPIFALFFILAGAELDISVVSKGIVVLIGLVYLVVRCGGKVAGVTLGSLLVRAPARCAAT